MPSTSRTRSRALLAVPLLAALALGVSACGNNGATEQSQEHSVVGGASGQAGSVVIRNAGLTLGIDGGALLSVAFVNEAAVADVLTSISSTQAASFVLPADPGYVSAYGDPSANPGDAGVPAAGATAAPSVSPTSPGAASTGVESVALPSQLGVFFGQDLNYIEVNGLTGDPLVGASVPITFSFRGGGTVTLPVPVIGGPTAGSTYSPEPAVTAANAAGNAVGSE